MTVEQNERGRENTASLEASGIPFTVSDGGRCLSFREPGKPTVDFYPHTGRRRRMKPKWVGGVGAEMFLRWYRAQSENSGKWRSPHERRRRLNTYRRRCLTQNEMHTAPRGRWNAVSGKAWPRSHIPLAFWLNARARIIRRGRADFPKMAA